VIKSETVHASRDIAHRIKPFVRQAHTVGRTDNRAKPKALAPTRRNCPALVQRRIHPRGIDFELARSVPAGMPQPASRDHRHKGPAKAAKAGASHKAYTIAHAASGMPLYPTPARFRSQSKHTYRCRRMPASGPDAAPTSLKRPDLTDTHRKTPRLCNH